MTKIVRLKTGSQKRKGQDSKQYAKITRLKKNQKKKKNARHDCQQMWKTNVNVGLVLYLLPTSNLDTVFKCCTK